MTPTQFAWRCADCGAFPPPEVRRGDRYGADALCWLCAGPTNGVGWPLSTGLAPTFTDFPRAKAPASQTVCQECVAMSRTEGWGQYVRAHPERGFAEAFPQKDDKAQRGLNWLYMSHLFAPHHHETPQRKRCRELLLVPPPAPFLFCIALSGQKHVIFKGEVARDRHRFPVQVDDERIYVDREEFAEFLQAFEALYCMGFSKDTVAEGRDWNHARILRVGLGTWRAAEAEFAPLRNRHPGFCLLAVHCAQRPEDWTDPIKAPATTPPIEAESAPLVAPATKPQGALF